MKRILFLLIFLFCFFNNVVAEDFKVDVSKINIDTKSNVLIDDLNNNFKIEASSFNSLVEGDKEVKEYTKKLIGIIFSDDSASLKRKNLMNESVLSDTNGFETLTSTILIESFIEELNQKKLSYEYVKYIYSSNIEDGVLSYAYLANVEIDSVKTDMVLTFYLKKVKGSYRLYVPFYTTGDKISEYFKKIGEDEDSGDNVGGKFKGIALEGTKTVSDEDLKIFYDNYHQQNASISALNNGDVNSYGSGFFIRKGIIVTTWSLFLQMLNTSEFIYVNDTLGNTYNIEGIVVADAKYDVVLIKLKDEVGIPVNFSDNINSKDNVFMITSKNNSYFSVNYGNSLSVDKDIIKTSIAISSSDVGSALYNQNGEVIGFNTNSIINSSLSVANKTKYLSDVQSKLINTEYEKIDVVKLSDLKEKYYFDLKEEKVKNNVPENVMAKIKKIGKMEDTIKFDLLKASYEDNIISLRYNNSVNTLDSLILTIDFETELINEGYKCVYETLDKKVYENGNYEIIIKNSLNYLIIIIMEK